LKPRNRADARRQVTPMVWRSRTLLYHLIFFSRRHMNSIQTMVVRMGPWNSIQLAISFCYLLYLNIASSLKSFTTIMVFPDGFYKTVRNQKYSCRLPIYTSCPLSLARTQPPQIRAPFPSLRVMVEAGSTGAFPKVRLRCA